MRTITHRLASIYRHTQSCLVAVTLAICFFSSQATAAESGSAEAFATISRLRSIVWGDLYPEFKSAEDTYSRARDALARKEYQEADRLFRLTILKGAILERKALEEDLVESAADDDNEFPRLVGNEFYYTVRKQDTVRLLAAKFGVSTWNILRLNRLKKGEQLRAGQRLRIVTLRIVPKEIKQGIVINIPDRTMYLFKEGRLESMYPVAVGKPSFKGKRGWHTPTGSFRIVAKLRNPVWRVPLSIQDEMKSQGKEILEEVPPGNANPLGRYALRTSIPGILIHGTNSPASIYGFSSHGCIRVYPDHMAQLYLDVSLRTSGEIVYKPVKLAYNDDGRVFLEVHPDVYDKVKNLEVEAWRVITGNNANANVDWAKVMNAVKTRSGIPEDVTLEPGTHSRGAKIAHIVGG